MRVSTAVVPALAVLLLATPAALAQSNWGGGGRPVFDSDVKRQQEQAETERAERRKTYGPVVYPKFMQGGERPNIPPATPPIVFFDRAEEPGSIIIDTEARKLYYVLPGKKAYEYPISVGRDGFTWTGTERISRIAEWPSWTPPPEMHKRVPGLPITVTGGLKNPQGARALYLGNTIYRIHGTNNDRTVGRANSSGCFRLTNEHVVHLASIAKVGTRVKVLHAYSGSVSQNAPAASLLNLFGSAEEPQQPSAATPKPRKPAAKKPPAAPPAVKSADATATQPAAAPPASAIETASTPAPEPTTASE